MYYGRLTRVVPTKRNKPGGKYLKTVAQQNPQDHWSEITVPSIITPELFQTVQALMANSKITNPRRSKYLYILRHRRALRHFW
jgi:hypothetical protein